MLVVRDYDEAIAFYCGKLGFELIEDTYQPEQDKRWVVVAPAGGGTSLVLGRASNERQEAAIGNQTGGRVFLFLQTDDFARDHALYLQRGVTFVREPIVAGYGTVAPDDSVTAVAERNQVEPFAVMATLTAKVS